MTPEFCNTCFWCKHNKCILEIEPEDWCWGWTPRGKDIYGV